MPFLRWFTVTHRVHGPGGTVRIPLRFVPADVGSFREILIFGGYELQINSASTYVDAGANTGMAAAYFAAQYPLERMLLIEANPALASQLGRAVEGIPHHVEVERVALAGHDGRVAFSATRNHRHGGIGVTGGRLIAVASRTLRRLLDEHDMQQVDILKMDIEGAEHDVLNGDPDILNRVRCLVMELHNSRESRDATAKLVARQGFEVQHDRDVEVDMLVAVRR